MSSNNRAMGAYWTSPFSRPRPSGTRRPTDRRACGTGRGQRAARAGEFSHHQRLVSARLLLVVGPVIAVVGYGLFMIPNVGGSYGINYLSRPEGAAEAVRAIESAGSRAQAFQADVAQVAEIRRLFAGVAAAFGGIDIVVANAGMPFIGVPVIDVTEEDFDRVYGVNNKGSFFVMQEAARRVRHGGRIVDISSSTTFF